MWLRSFASASSVSFPWNFPRANWRALAAPLSKSTLTFCEAPRTSREALRNLRSSLDGGSIVNTSCIIATLSCNSST